MHRETRSAMTPALYRGQTLFSVKGMSDWLLGLTRCFLRVEWLPGDREGWLQHCVLWGWPLFSGAVIWVNSVQRETFEGENFRKFWGFVAICESFHLLEIWGCGVPWQHQSFGGVAFIGGTSEESVKVFSCASFSLHSSKLLDSIHYWERYVPYTGQRKRWTSNLS